jgi:hypothetical protein
LGLFSKFKISGKAEKAKINLPVSKTIITNNPMVRDKFPGQEVEFYDTDYMGVLKIVRDKIHLGCELLTHPLSGSVKPGETPYKTVIINDRKGDLDEKALSVIEESIQTCAKLEADTVRRELSAKMLSDFQLVDFSLIIA